MQVVVFDQCDKISHQIFKKINQLRRTNEVLEQKNKSNQQSCEILIKQQMQLQGALTKIQNLEHQFRVLAQKQIKIADLSVHHKSKQAIQQFKSKIKSQEKIISNTVINLSNNSLDQVQEFYDQITFQSVAQLAKEVNKNKIILTNLQKTKQKYERIRQNRLKAGKQQKNIVKKNKSQKNGT